MNSGFEPLTKQIAEAEAALADISGKLGDVTFEADDPASIEAAIVSLHAMIRDRMLPYMTNPFIAPLVDALMEDCRQAVIDSARAGLLGGEA